MGRIAAGEPEPSSSAGPANRARIAELAGVSMATVSRVVTGRRGVAPETRALVEAVLGQHGLQRQKRRQKPPRTHLELVFHELEGAYAMELIRGAERALADRGMGVAISQLGGQHGKGGRWIERILAPEPSGVVGVFSGLSDAQCAQLQVRGVPVVALDPSVAPSNTPWVGAGNWTGGLIAARYLLALGHRRIATITGPSRVLSSNARRDGYRAALDDAGVTVDPELVREGDFHVEDGVQHGRNLLSLPDPPTAIVTGNDLQALGVYQAAAEAGLRIPHDLSVIGFDDLPLARWASPPLTTVRQPLAEMAAAAVGMALAMASDEPLEQERVEFATRLVVRGSTAEPRAA